MRPSAVLLFLDGVGLGTAGAHNPLSQTNTMPFVTQLVGQPLLAEAQHQSRHCLLKPIDATLQVPGLPQSATGQTTIYTGRNAPQYLGRHQTAFANGSLRPLIEASGLLKQVLHQGGTATLANLYSPAYFEAIANRRLRYSVGTLLNLTAGLTFRMQYEYEQGAAIFWDITGEFAASRGIAHPPISAQAAGVRLANLGRQYSLTLFECYLPDFAGHAQNLEQAQQCLRRIDRLIQATVEHLSAEVTLVITSDHGNVEDLSTKRHTLNAVPLLVIGPQAPAFSAVADLTGITPKLLESLQLQPRSADCRLS
ncbi:MAG: metalloenzyme [Leptolyngbya sp. SIO4C1]|nr:metalloenzyme [Leptolyngbya sp. SIO4C1]